MVMIPKHSPHRDRKLLDLAHQLHECTNCGHYIPEGLEPAHSNWSTHGKGASRKADDWAHAGLCNTCHSWLDSGSGDDPTGIWKDTEKREMWRYAHDKTMRAYWVQGWVRVA